MNKIFSFVTLLILTYNSYSQSYDVTEWSPEGATWIYDIVSATSQSFLEISYIKDTIVSGVEAKQFLERQITFTGPNLQLRNAYNLGYIYLYNSNDSIYFYDNGNFEFIYNFSPSINDEFILRKNYKSYCNTPGYPDSDTVQVIDIKQDTLSNLIFDVFWLLVL